MIDWIKEKLGIKKLESQSLRQENRLQGIENLVQVGVDLNFKTPSWAVVCLRGKNQDIVRFFNLPDNDIAHILDYLKELERRFHINPVFDAPISIRKEFLKW